MSGVGSCWPETDLELFTNMYVHVPWVVIHVWTVHPMYAMHVVCILNFFMATLLAPMIAIVACVLLVSKLYMCICTRLSVLHVLVHVCQLLKS